VKRGDRVQVKLKGTPLNGAKGTVKVIATSGRWPVGISLDSQNPDSTYYFTREELKEVE